MDFLLPNLGPFPTGHLGGVKMAVRAITGIFTQQPRPCLLPEWLPPSTHWFNHFVFYLQSQKSSPSMVESWKITLIIEKNPVPSKEVSYQSKRHGVKFPGDTGETYTFPHTKENRQQDPAAGTAAYVQEPAPVRGGWMPWGRGETVEFHTKQLLCFGFYTRDRILRMRCHPSHSFFIHWSQLNHIIWKIHHVFPK